MKLTVKEKKIIKACEKLNELWIENGEGLMLWGQANGGLYLYKTRKNDPNLPDSEGCLFDFNNVFSDGGDCW